MAFVQRCHRNSLFTLRLCSAGVKVHAPQKSEAKHRFGLLTRAGVCGGGRSRMTSVTVVVSALKESFHSIRGGTRDIILLSYSTGS